MTEAVNAIGGAGEPPPPTPLDTGVTAHKSAKTDTGAAKVRVVERQKEVPAPGPTFEVMLNDKTLRLYSELLDPTTGQVLLRIPDSYSAGQGSDGSNTGAGGVEQVA